MAVLHPDLGAIGAHILKSYDSGNATAEPWRSLPEIPSAAEIMGIHENHVANDGDLLGDIPEDPSALPENKVKGPWKDPASYIAAHYRLLREDSIYPLRQAVADVKASPYMGDSLSTAIYTHVS